MTNQELPQVTIISGTPGVGKTTISLTLKNKGFSVLNLNNIISENGLYYGYDFTRDSLIIDEDILHDFLISYLSNINTNIIIEGHISELVPAKFVKKIILLRCNPAILRKRLQSSRDYDSIKIESNVEAEIMDVCLFALREKFPDYEITEIDTTYNSVDEISERIYNIIIS